VKVFPKPRNLWFEDGFWWYACPSKRAVTRISGLIRDELFDIEAIAGRLGVSRRGFERLVNNSLGISPGMWLRPERAVWAAFRIREGYSISEISEQLGFKHQGDFCAEFKRWHQILPSQYRQVARKRCFVQKLGLDNS
jgi:AraC-like DNA-binding protein